MRALVTGAAGFIGSHLGRRLVAEGVDLVQLDNFDPVYDPEIKAKNVVPGARLIRGDVADPDVVSEALSGVDVVFHLAARAGVRPSLVDPEPYVQTNIVGTARLLAGMRKLGVGRLVFASSSSVYGARRGELFREDDPADRPESPYAATKRAGELLCHAAHVGWGLNVSCLRLFTVYGPRQRPEMGFARFLRQLRAGEALTLYGDGNSVRDYTFVGDAVDALAAAAAAPGFTILNVAGGGSVTLNSAVQTLASVAGVTKPEFVHLPDQPGDVPETRADLSRAREVLGWQPKTSLRAGLGQFVEQTP